MKNGAYNSAVYCSSIQNWYQINAETKLSTLVKYVNYPSILMKIVEERKFVKKKKQGGGGSVVNSYLRIVLPTCSTFNNEGIGV